MTPFAKVLSAKLLEVVKRLETSARRAGAGTVMHAAQAVLQKHQHLRLKAVRIYGRSACIPEAENPRIGSDWTPVEWMRTTRECLYASDVTV
jgi:hypothetical protein